MNVFSHNNIYKSKAIWLECTETCLPTILGIKPTLKYIYTHVHVLSFHITPNHLNSIRYTSRLFKEWILWSRALKNSATSLTILIPGMCCFALSFCHSSRTLYSDLIIVHLSYWQVGFSCSEVEYRMAPIRKYLKRQKSMSDEMHFHTKSSLSVKLNGSTMSVAPCT